MNVKNSTDLVISQWTCFESTTLDDNLNILHPASDNDVDNENYNNEYPFNITGQSIDTISHPVPVRLRSNMAQRC